MYARMQSLLHISVYVPVRRCVIGLENLVLDLSRHTSDKLCDIRKRAVREKECHGLGHPPILRQETPSSRGAHLFQSRSAHCQYLFETFACSFDFAFCAAPRPSGTQLIVKRVPTPLEKLCHVSDRHLALEPIPAECEIAFREDFHSRISVTLLQPETVGEQGFPFPDGIVFHVIRHVFHLSLPFD